jgi:PleD family two-component response regulator
MNKPKIKKVKKEVEVVELTVEFPKYLYDQMMEEKEITLKEYGKDLSISEFLSNAYQGMNTIINEQRLVIYQLKSSLAKNGIKVVSATPENQILEGEDDEIGRSYH